MRLQQLPMENSEIACSFALAAQEQYPLQIIPQEDNS
jgi:hypothetical protein